ncbi:MAG: S49 family peptidase [Acidocella sp.]|nr:S49 family peptidase [Acidocella sp.]
MLSFPFARQNMFNTLLALRADRVDALTSLLPGGLGGIEAHLMAAQLRPLREASTGPVRHWAAGGTDRGYDVINGIAVIKICGVLVHRLGVLRPAMGMTGYDGIRAAFTNALRDRAVQAIVLDIDSPGGDVCGCFDLVDKIYQARGTKPVRAILGENAFSAAYAIASATDWITVPRTGGAGSIGVMMMVLDISKALASEGVGVTVIQFGARKADGMPELPLSKAARKLMQADVNTVGELFVKTVARNRKMKPAAIKALEARTFQGAAALKVGLVDGVTAPETAFGRLAKALQVKRTGRLGR